MNSFLLELLSWAKNHGMRILLIFFSAYLIAKFSSSLIEKLVRKIISRDSFASAEEEKKREDTIITILRRLIHILIWFGVIFLVFEEIGVPVAPLLTGAGIFGVALGFGAQSLMKDFITGIFIITENQFRIGDYICIADKCGTVEDMTLRVTKIRELDGTIHYIPNSEIRVSSNKSKDYSMVNLKIGVSYGTDFDLLEKVINKVGEEMKNDPVFGDLILEEPRFLRIDDFADSSIVVHILGKVYPKKQYLVTGELRKRIKKAFDENGIEIPYPVRVIHLEKEK